MRFSKSKSVVNRLRLVIPLLGLCAAASAQNGPTVLVNGKPVVFETARPMILKGHTVVPMRGIFEAIGATVVYDEANHIIQAHKNNEVVELKMYSRIARKNGAEIRMDERVQIYAGTAMVPLRFISEALGATVEFDRPGNRILITTEGI